MNFNTLSQERTYTQQVRTSLPACILQMCRMCTGRTLFEELAVQVSFEELIRRQSVFYAVTHVYCTLDSILEVA